VRVRLANLAILWADRGASSRKHKHVAQPGNDTNTQDVFFELLFWLFLLTIQKLDRLNAKSLRMR
jgi:hypothetical protein